MIEPVLYRPSQAGMSSKRDWRRYWGKTKFMDKGYSNFTGEFIEASDIEYDDCRRLQIVCPGCRDAVYKVVRNNNEKLIHYLSHYKQVEFSIEKCEFRVDSITASEVSENNKKSRQQRLEYFMKVFKDIIYSHVIHRDGTPEEIDAHFDFQNSIYGMNKLYSEVRSLILLKTPEKAFRSSEEFFIKSIDEANRSFSTTLHQATQTRIAHDIWLTLNSMPNKRNLKLLFNHAYFIAYSKFIGMSEGGEGISDTEKNSCANNLRVLEAVILCKTKSETNNLWKNNADSMKYISSNLLDFMISELMTFHYAEALAREYGDNSIDYPENDGLAYE